MKCLQSARRNGAAVPLGRCRAFTLVEWLVVLAIIGTIAGIGVPAYNKYIDRANVVKAITDIRMLEQIILRYEVKNEGLPNTLADIGAANFKDPWGNPYRYLRIEGAGLKGKGSLRKDKKLNPLNSDYDLYSMGKNGDTKLPLTAKPSHDDVVRANNGAFVGLAVSY